MTVQKYNLNSAGEVTNVEDDYVGAKWTLTFKRNRASTVLPFLITSGLKGNFS